MSALLDNRRLVCTSAVSFCSYRRKRKYQNSVVDDDSLSHYEPSARSPFPAKVTGNGLIGSTGGAAGVRGAMLRKDTESNGSYTNSSASGSGSSSGTGYVTGPGAGYSGAGYNQGGGAGYAASNYSTNSGPGAGSGYAASNYSANTGADSGYAASNFSSHAGAGAGAGYDASNYGYITPQQKGRAAPPPPRGTFNACGQE